MRCAVLCVPALPHRAAVSVIWQSARSNSLISLPMWWDVIQMQSLAASCRMPVRLNVLAMWGAMPVLVEGLAASRRDSVDPVSLP